MLPPATSRTRSRPVKGSVPAEFVVVTVVEPLPVPAVPLLTVSHVWWWYPWHVDDELARAIPGAKSARTPRIPTNAEKRFMNPFVRRGSPKNSSILHEPPDTVQGLTSPNQSSVRRKLPRWAEKARQTGRNPPDAGKN